MFGLELEWWAWALLALWFVTAVLAALAPHVRAFVHMLALWWVLCLIVRYGSVERVRRALTERRG